LAWDCCLMRIEIEFIGNGWNEGQISVLQNFENAFCCILTTDILLSYNVNISILLC
jgi:hypothetical protein